MALRWCRVLYACLSIATATFVEQASAAEPPPLEAYGQLPSISAMRLSPEGERVAYFGFVDGARALIASGIDGRPLGAWQLGEFKLRSIRWVDESRLIVSASDFVKLGPHWGYEYEVWRDLLVDIKSKSVRPLLDTRTTLGITACQLGLRFVDGHWYSYVMTQFNTLNNFGPKSLEGASAARVNLDTLKIEKLVGANEDFTYWLVDSAGSIVANAQYQDRSGLWHLYAGRDIGRELASAPDPTHSSRLIGLGRTPRTALYSTSSLESGTRYYEIPFDDTGKKVPVASAVFDDVDGIENLITDVNTDLLAGYRADLGRKIVMFDPMLQARVAAIRKGFGTRQLELINWNRQATRFLVFAEGPGEAGAYWFVDTETGKTAKLAEQYPHVPSQQVAENRVIEYKAADGLVLQGVLTLPPGREPKSLPLIVKPHAGPESHSIPTFDWWSQAFASRGYAVFRPNFRGSSGVSEKLRLAGAGEMGRKMQTDLSDGVAELARLGIVDPARVCIVGSDYGGYAALAGVTLQHGIYRCAVAAAAYSDLVLEKENFKSEAVERRWKRYLGISDSGDVKFRELSPSMHAADADAPILLIHGREDTVISIEHSEHMNKALQHADKPVEFIKLDGEDHWYSRSNTRLALLKASVAFVEKHNPAVVP